MDIVKKYHTIDVHGIILKESKHSNTSKIVRIYTDQMGLISVYAKGVLKNGSRLFALTHLFSEVSLTLRSGKNFYYLVDGTSNSYKSFVTGDLKKTLMLTLISEIILRSHIESEPSMDGFHLLKETMQLFSEDLADPYAVLLMYLLKFMTLMGFKPDFNRCGECNSTHISIATFRIERGDLICQNCREKRNAVEISLSHDEIMYLNELLYGRIVDAAEKSHPSGKHYIRMMLDYSRFHLELPELKTFHLMQQLNMI